MLKSAFTASGANSRCYSDELALSQTGCMVTL